LSSRGRDIELLVFVCRMLGGLRTKKDRGSKRDVCSPSGKGLGGESGKFGDAAGQLGVGRVASDGSYASKASGRKLADYKEGTLTCKQRVFLYVEDPGSSCVARAVSVCILSTIVISIACFVLETYPPARAPEFWKIMEYISSSIFIVEYVSRLWACNAFQSENTRWKFIKAPMNALDLAAILPVFIDVVLKQLRPLRVLRSVRLIRLFRIFKLGKYSSRVTIMVQTIRNSVQPLTILMFFLTIGVVLFSSLIYYAEKGQCPDVYALQRNGGWGLYKADCIANDNARTSDGVLCCNEGGSPIGFESIITTAWWAIVTMTTVGYGDLVPRTMIGRALSVVAMLCGILLISLPVAIVGSKFQEVYEEYEDSENERKQALQLQSTASLESTSALPGVSVRDLSPAPVGGVPGIAIVQGSIGLADARPRSRDSAESTRPGTRDSGTKSTASSPIRRKRLCCSGLADPGAPRVDLALQKMTKLKDKVTKLEAKSGLSSRACEQVKTLLELFDHLERVDRQSQRLQREDAELQKQIRGDWSQLLSDYEGRFRGPPPEEETDNSPLNPAA